MVRVAIIGKQKDAIEPMIRDQYHGLLIDDHNPDMVFCYGGDGTFLHAERTRPHIPKLFLRRTMLCDSCKETALHTMLGLVEKEQYTIASHPKIDITTQEQVRRGVYDVMVGHARINKAIRFQVKLNNAIVIADAVADAIVVATPIGSTGYFQSITREQFATDFGAALSNSVRPIKPIHIQKGDVLEIELLRGPAVGVADNEEKGMHIHTGDVVTIQASEHIAQIVEFNPGHSQYNFLQRRYAGGDCQVCGVTLVP